MSETEMVTCSGDDACPAASHIHGCFAERPTPPSPDPDEWARAKTLAAKVVMGEPARWVVGLIADALAEARALAARRPATETEQAVKRQSAAALCDLTFRVVGRYVAGSTLNAIAMEVNRVVLPAALGITEAELRAALGGAARDGDGQ